MSTKKIKPNFELYEYQKLKLNAMISIDSCVYKFSFYSFTENVRQTIETLSLPFGSGKKMIACSRITQWLIDKISSCTPSPPPPLLC